MASMTSALLQEVHSKRDMATIVKAGLRRAMQDTVAGPDIDCKVLWKDHTLTALVEIAGASCDVTQDVVEFIFSLTTNGYREDKVRFDECIVNRIEDLHTRTGEPARQ